MLGQKMPSEPPKDRESYQFSDHEDKCKTDDGFKYDRSPHRIYGPQRMRLGLTPDMRLS